MLSYSYVLSLFVSVIFVLISPADIYLFLKLKWFIFSAWLVIISRKVFQFHIENYNILFLMHTELKKSLPKPLFTTLIHFIAPSFSVFLFCFLALLLSNYPYIIRFQCLAVILLHYVNLLDYVYLWRWNDACRFIVTEPY